MKKIIILLSILLLAASCNPFSKPLPGGVIKSTNGGTDWQYANVFKGSTTLSLSGLSISKLAFSPLDRQTLFAGTYTDGLFKSEDAAASWTKILSKIFVYDFVIDQLNPKIIYVAGTYANHGRVLKTVDGGGSWEQIYNEESINNPVRSIALNSTNSNQLVIGTASGVVIKSADAGVTWQLAKNFTDQVNRVLWQNGKIYVLLKTKGLFGSVDFGLTFNDITTALNKTFSLVGLSYTEGSSIDSFSQIYVDGLAPNLIYITTDKGLYKSINSGANWTPQKLPVKPNDSSARAIAVSPSSSNIVVASVGSTVYKSNDAGNTWQTEGITSSGFVNYLVIDPQIPQIIYGGIYIIQN